MRRKRSSITDVARQAGVSVATVSRVINHAAGVSEDMARHVAEIIRQLAYQPLAEDRRPGPKAKRPPQGAPPEPGLELIVMFRLGLGWIEEQAPVYSRAFDGIEAAAAQAGFRLTVRQIAHAGARLPTSDPSIVARLYFGSGDLAGQVPLPDDGLPAVWVMGDPVAGFAGDVVLPDHHAIGVLAARTILAAGHTCCAYLGTMTLLPTIPLSARAEGFRQHIEKHGGHALMVADPTLTRTTATSNAADPVRVDANLAAVLCHEPRPTALFLQSDLLAPAVYAALLRAGVVPQQDLMVVSCNNDRRYLDALRPQPPVIDVQAEALGALAVDTLGWRLAHPGAPAIRTLVSPRLA